MPNRTPRILYIDDDPGLSRLVEKAMGRRGLLFEHAATGEAGLERIKAGGIDVVALDHYLPTGTGLDVLAQMGANYLARSFFVVIVGGAGSIGGIAAGSAVVGGLDSPGGALLGGLTVGVVTSVVTGYLGSTLAPVAVLALLVVVLLVRPSGLFAQAEARRA